MERPVLTIFDFLISVLTSRSAITEMEFLYLSGVTNYILGFDIAQTDSLDLTVIVFLLYNGPVLLNELLFTDPLEEDGETTTDFYDFLGVWNELCLLYSGSAFILIFFSSSLFT